MSEQRIEPGTEEALPNEAPATVEADLDAALPNEASGVIEAGVGEAIASGTPAERVEALLDALDQASSAAERAALLREAGEIYEERLREPEHARLAYVQALAEEPTHAPAAAAVERLCETPEHWFEVLQALGESLGEAESTSVQADLYALVGRWYSVQLGRDDLALNYLAEATRQAPTSMAAWSSVIELQRKAHQWEPLVASLAHAASLTADPGGAAELRAEAADVLQERLRDPERAAPIYLQVLEALPDHAAANDAYEASLRDRGLWPDLADHLQRLASTQPAPASVEAELRLAALHATELDAPDQAIESYRRALDAMPESEQPSTLEAMAELQLGLERTADAIATLRQLLASDVPSTRERLATLEKTAALLTDEREFEEAAALWEQALDLDPGLAPAYAALGALHRRTQRFGTLVSLQEKWASSCEVPSERIDIFMEAARTAISDLSDRDRAVELCERALGLDPDHVEALRLVARLRTSHGDLNSAAAALDTLADSETDSTKQAHRLVEAGTLLEEDGNLDAAADRYRRALKALPGLPGAVDALRGLYAQRGDDDALVTLLEELAEGASSNDDRAALLLELAGLRRNSLAQPAQAREVYLESLELSPSNNDAPLALGDMAYADQDWQGVAEYFTPLLDRTAQLPPQVALRVGLRCGQAHEELDDLDAADRAYQIAQKLAPNHPLARLALGGLSAKRGEHTEAITLLRPLLERSRDRLDVAEVTRGLRGLAEAYRGSGQLKEAADALEDAAQLNPDDDATLAAVAALRHDLKDWDGLLSVLRRRQATAAPNAQVDLWCEMAEVLSGRLSQVGRAIECLEAALKRDAENRNVLAKLMPLYTQEERWADLARTLTTLAALTDQPPVRAKYLTTAASVTQKRLHDRRGAAALYASVLELTPDDARAFARRVECLQAVEDFEDVAEAYRERLKTSLGDAEAAACWHGLGDTLTAMGRSGEECLVNYEHANRLAPDVERHLRLLELYGEDPARHGEALVASTRAVWKERPCEVEAYRAVRKLYTSLEQPDAVWCSVQALVSLGAATEDENAFFAKYKSSKAAAPQSCLDDGIWSHMVVHPEQSPLVTELFGALLPAAMSAHRKTAAEAGLVGQHPCDAERDGRLVVRMLHYAAGVTDTRLPAIVHRPDDPGGISVLPMGAPVIAFGLGAIADVADQAMAFVAGSTIGYLRAGHLMRRLEPTGRGLRAWLLAAIRTTDSTFPVPAELAELVDRNLKAIASTLSAEQTDNVGSLVKRLMDDAPELDMKRWARAVDFTADRVGFILADSLLAARAVIEAGSDAEGSSDRLDQLHAYAASPEYLALRQQLEISID